LIAIHESTEAAYVDAGHALVARPKVPRLHDGSFYELGVREGPLTRGTGVPIRVDLDTEDVFGCCLCPSRKATAVGFDTTGDGFVDSLDTTGDGFLDSVLSVVHLPEEHVVAAREERISHGDIGSQARQIFDTIDSDHSGSISKFDLVGAMQRHRHIDNFVLPSASGAKVFSDESGQTFEAIEGIFAAISGGSSRIQKDAFVQYFQKQGQNLGQQDEVHMLFSDIDADHSGTLSKYEILAAVQRIPALAALVVPHKTGKATLSEEVWKDVDEFFDNVSGGKNRVSFEDFATFYHIHTASPPVHQKPDRASKRVLIIGPGFGRELNPAQSALVIRSGYKTQFILDIPNPETPGFQMAQHLPKVAFAVQQFRPHLIACASKGWPYVLALWNGGITNYATLMINAHPHITKLPKQMNVVVAHGSNDECYSRTRQSLESLMSTGDFNRCFLYWSANSGQVKGGYSRYGDKHNMASLLTYDLLPRLMDAAMSACPENEIVFSWQDRLGSQRKESEACLSGDPAHWARKWEKNGKDILHTVPVHSEEFNAVFRLFHASPPEPPNYQQAGMVGGWTARFLKLERVQNTPLLQGMQTYYKKIGALFQDEGIEFAPNVHSRWVFHGTDAIDAIVTDPVTGFQPLVSGSRLGSLWGSGTYFARDAKYVAESNFCPRLPDGTKKMLLCLITIGIPCLGDPEHKGILPHRNGHPRYKYNSTVDSLSSPEIFIIQEPSAGYPAYVITFQ